MRITDDWVPTGYSSTLPESSPSLSHRFKSFLIYISLFRLLNRQVCLLVQKFFILSPICPLKDLLKSQSAKLRPASDFPLTHPHIAGKAGCPIAAADFCPVQVYSI